MTKRRFRATAPRDPNALVLHATVSALDPEALHSQTEQSVRALLKEGESANTVRSYASALRYWAAWHRLRYRAALALPVPVPERLTNRAVAIVGTREPTQQGRQIAERITQYFAANRWQVVSGLALGIDTVVHTATLSSNSTTVAVLAHGLDKVYPPENAELADRIVEQGGVLMSEYAYGSRSFPSNFVERDRIQAGLACGVVMVQSDESGGSWHASRAALRYGRYLIIPRPTEADVKAQQPKIRGNQLIAESSAEVRAAFLKCSAKDLERLFVLQSREDYPTVESTLLQIRSAA
jgi:DNA processing protein